MTPDQQLMYLTDDDVDADAGTITFETESDYLRWMQTHGPG